MHKFVAYDVNDAYYKGVKHLHDKGQWESSRNGAVIACPHPVLTEFARPYKRVLMSPIRNANPWFHMMEAMWMLCGRRDVRFLCEYNKRMAEFSDDGESLNGAYGHRWRQYFDIDQLNLIIEMLLSEPNTRRAVLGMWSPADDLGSASKDIPCNTHIYFRLKDSAKLDMTVCNRSNDIIWGLYGANAVHMSFLHEYVCKSTGLGIGRYYHFSNNFHCYPDKINWYEIRNEPSIAGDFYDTHPSFRYVPIFDRKHERENFTADLYEFIEDGTTGLDSPFEFIKKVLVPMWQTWAIRKDVHRAYELCDTILAEDWQYACKEWLRRKFNEQS